MAAEKFRIYRCLHLNAQIYDDLWGMSHWHDSLRASHLVLVILLPVFSGQSVVGFDCLVVLKAHGAADSKHLE